MKWPRVGVTQNNESYETAPDWPAFKMRGKVIGGFLTSLS